MFCYTDGNNPHGSSVGDIGPVDHCYSAGNFACFPCGEHRDDYGYWLDLCNQTYPACNGECGLWNFCSRDAPLGHTYCRARTLPPVSRIAKPVTASLISNAGTPAAAPVTR